MSDGPAARKRPNYGRIIGIAAALVVGGFVLLTILAMAGLFQPILVGYEMTTGIWRYPVQVLPRVQFNAGSIAIFALALIGTSVGLHTTARWLRSAKTPAGLPWQPRWTVAGLAAMFVGFAVAVDMAAVVHQTTWLIRAPAKSVFYDRYRDSPMHLVGSKCARIRKGDLATLAQPDALAVLDQWDIELIRTATGTPGAVVAHPRDPRSPFSGRTFTCDGMMDEKQAADYVAEIESLVPPGGPKGDPTLARPPGSPAPK